MAKVIAVTNQKGGVGKTTTSVNLVACLAAAEYRTLLIDVDPQGNATSGIGLDKNAVSPTVYDALLDGNSHPNLFHDTMLDHLKCIPANGDLVGAEIELAQVDGGKFALKRVVESLANEFDFVVMDCPPSLGMLTLNALIAADSYLVPLQCEYYPLEGLALLQKTISAVQKGLNPTLKLEGVVLTMYDGRTNLAVQVAKDVRETFPNLVFETVIPRNISIAEAPSYGKPIILYDIRSKGAVSYINLTKELLTHDGK